jgi:glucokinase
LPYVSRLATLLMKDSTPLAIGIDIGATKIAAVLMDRNGRTLATRLTPTRSSEGEQAVFDRVAGLAHELIETARQPVEGVGIGTPGRVNPADGIVYGAVNLGWEGVDLLAGVRARLPQDLRVWAAKDANASALGEYYFGAARGIDDFVYLGVGSGLGSGFLTHGHLVVGSTWIAGDLGHLSLDPQGLPCTCGLQGCVETILSGPGLVNCARRYVDEGRLLTHLRAGDELTPAGVLEAAQTGDPLALAALEEAGRLLGALLAICVTTLNPAMIVIGGGLGLAAFDYLAPPARAELARRALRQRWKNMAIVPSKVANSAAGAACLVWYKGLE